MNSKTDSLQSNIYIIATMTVYKNTIPTQSLLLSQHIVIATIESDYSFRILLSVNKGHCKQAGDRWKL